MMKNVSFALIQLSVSENLTENWTKTIQSIRDAAAKGAQVICLQELFQSIYFCYEENTRFFELAEAIPGPSTDELGELAKELNVVIIASLFEKRAAGLYHNTTAVIDADGSYLGKYRKMHIPDDPGYYEKYYFTPGDLGYQVYQTKFAKIGVLICWDQWYPEAARLTALKGAEVLVYPTAIGWDLEEKNGDINREQYQAWQTIQRSHAIANGIPVVSVNRVGIENGQQFWGGSFVSNAFGRVMYQAPHDQEEIAVLSVDVESSEYYRKTWPFFRDRRIDSYGNVVKRFVD
ncbi:carbon-nitrogen hydrolase [Aquirufa ecclesiirivi]|uniref:carbon-nitrogen hydrolase n=1 Tax=Aquirufa ecclesiirivi TaxID=2715124 RepID=UPI003BAEA9F2